MTVASRRCTAQKTGTQQVGVLVDLLPGPSTDAVASRVLEIVVQELITTGAEVTAVSVEVRGHIGSW